MRVIAGDLKGRKLVAPPGEKTRPTADRIKESIFNIIQFDIEGRDVLDLFAGSGQMGIEALSRGAARAVFVDERQDSVKAIRQNLKTTGLEAKGQVLQADAFAYVKNAGAARFGLIFLDPPYGGAWLKKSVAAITAFDILKTGGIIICESGLQDDAGALPPPYGIKKEYKYGAKKITVVIKEQP